MPLTPSTSDLTTVEAYNRYAAESGIAASAQADLVQDTITAASLAIMDYCQADFAPADDGATRRYRYNGGGVLSLAPYVVRAIDSVTIDADSTSATELDADTWRIMPVPAPFGVYRVLHLFGVPGRDDLTSNTPQYRVVDIEGDFGYETVPAQVARACSITVGYLLKTGSQHQGDELDIAPVGWGGSGVLLPGNAKRLLAPFRMYSAGV